MPMIEFQCNNPECDNNITKYYKKIDDIPPFLDCGACGTGKLERGLSTPGTKSTQYVDNGLQARKVEVSKDIVEKEQEKLYNGNN